MNAFDTKILIARTYIELCNEIPMKKVSISDIIERTGKNRKTFYYHFVDKDSLTIWIYRYDMGQMLHDRFPETTLVYETPSESSVSQFPYYIRQKSSTKVEDHSRFFECLANVLENRRNFYDQALSENRHHSLRNYMYALYLPAMQNDIHTILANRYLPETKVQFLAEFYTCAFLYYFIRKIDQPGVDRLVPDPTVFGNLIQSSLEMEIKEASQNRALQQ